MSTYQPDAKTLIWHAMQALDDEMGINDADQFTSRLRQLFIDIRNWEDARAKKAEQPAVDTSQGANV